MFENELSQVRHKLRGRLQALSLCTNVLGHGTTPSEDAEFLADIITAASDIPALLDQLERLDHFESESPAASDRHIDMFPPASYPPPL